ncbi:RNA polymerase sigma factor [Paludisphaera rhizosphaerae]|uniref:RNA polymerase sigma factor n=1 Tax=Paludisphaera rhizosphaerae TaxID=2711216 RepID=UPI0013ECB0B8|nr:sigma-70 family RNA polymerase sigma factor [Paludisphaera rhizosphaerae]
MARDKEAVRLELLALRCRRGDARAFEELVREWEGRLFYYVRRLVATEEDAWDVLQQTWLRVYKSVGSLRQPERLPVWLYQVARCAAISHRRGRLRNEAHEESLDDPPDPTAEDDLDLLDRCEQVHVGLERLSPAHREILTLFFLEDLSLEQIAEVLEIPPGTAKSRLHYAKRALREILEREEDHR